jgi:hypothetical protein
MTDIVGPANAINVVTTRPAESRVFGAADTWFQDCSSATANDGTRIMAVWLNAIIAQLRNSIRINGNLIAGGAVVSEDNADAMFANAMEYLIQRGQPTYGDDTGTQNNIVVTLNPGAKEYKKGMVVVTIIKNNNGGATVLNVNGLGNQQVVRYDGTPLQQGDLIAGSMQAFAYDGAKFQLAWQKQTPGAPIYLQAARTYYVSNSGNDQNDGTTVGTAWATVQHAQDYIVRFNLNGFNITIQIADGAFGSVRFAMMSGSGFVFWYGNFATPANVRLTGTSTSAVTAVNCGTAHFIRGVAVAAGGAYTANDGMNGIQVAGAGTSLQVYDINWGTCNGSHLALSQNAVVTYAGNMTVSGPAQGGNQLMTAGWHVYCVDGAIIQQPSLSAVNLTVTTPITMGNGGWVLGATLAFTQVIYASITGGANVTGMKFWAGQFSVVSVAGAGINHYPGSSPGVVNGGIYG